MQTKSKTHRLHLIVTQGVRDKIEALQNRTDAGNMTEVIRRALALYDEVISIREEGGEILVENANGEQQRLLVL